MKIKKNLIESAIAGSIGYFILHPASMYIQCNHKSSLSYSRFQYVLEAFSLEHLDMALFFIVIGIAVGILHTYYTGKITTMISNIGKLEKLLPICAWCKKIRDDSKIENNNNGWIAVEKYISNRSKTHFTHGLCPDCEKKQLEEINRL